MTLEIAIVYLLLLAAKRLSTDDQGRVVYRYKRPFRDGSTHVILEPLDFIARLAAPVPRPRLNLTRFHGILPPNFKHRHKIVPRRIHGKVDSDKPLAPMNWAQRLNRVFAIDIESCPACGGQLRVIACAEAGANADPAGGNSPFIRFGMFQDEGNGTGVLAAHRHALENPQ